MDVTRIIALMVTYLAQTVFSGELTFELPDNEKMCFHETIEKGTSTTLEFQVLL